MSAHVLLNSLYISRKCEQMRGLLSILSLFRSSLINSIIHEHAFKTAVKSHFNVKTLRF